MLIPIFPCFILSVGELADYLIHHIACVIVRKILRFSCAVPLFVSFLLYLELNQTTDWPDADVYMDSAYRAYYTNTRVEELDRNEDSVQYWRYKILHETGFDIENPEGLSEVPEWGSETTE